MDRAQMPTSSLACCSLTAVVLVTVVVAIQVSVTAFAPQDTAARAALEVAGGALCRHGDKSPGHGQLPVPLTLTLTMTGFVPSTPASGSRHVALPPSSGNWLQSESSGHCSPTIPSTDSHLALALRHNNLPQQGRGEILLKQ